jgi:DNA-binding ferritin-like protein
LDAEQYFEAVNKAIDKTLQAYTKNGKLLVEDWDMFDQDLYTNASNELDKLYD